MGILAGIIYLYLPGVLAVGKAVFTGRAHAAIEPVKIPKNHLQRSIQIINIQMILHRMGDKTFE